jgi:hypothetical protein
MVIEADPEAGIMLDEAGAEVAPAVGRVIETPALPQNVTANWRVSGGLC